jgi:UDP-glucose 6-dehydrogenase
MIGIIGYGFVGKAVANGFPHTTKLICDPAYNDTTLQEIVQENPEAIFVCLPTPSDDTDYVILKTALNEIKEFGYEGVTVVKSTILPHHLEEFDVVLNPEFLSRATADEDFIDPPFVLFGGSDDKTEKLYNIYSRYSIVNMSKVMMTDVKTASLAKYTFNTFYSTKLIFMNQLYDVCGKVGVDFEELKDVLKMNPWMMGVSHLDVPGHEGRGFSGPCLPKDTEAFAKEFDLELLHTVLDLNTKYRKEEENGSH